MLFKKNLLLLLLTIPMLVCCSPSEKMQTSDMNVIMIGLDTTRADHLSCYGSTESRTPNLDRLARDGIRFDQCVTVVPSTLASFTSVMSGMYPRTHGVPRNGFRVPDRHVLLAERFKNAGYETAAFIASYALHSDHNFDQGFDLYEQTFDPEVTGDQIQRRSDRLNEALFPWLEARKDSKFFLFIHYFDPHAPYDPPLPYGHDPAVSGKPTWGHMNLLRLTERLAQNPDDEALDLARHASKMYAGEIEFLDDQIGGLMKKLDRLGLSEKSIIIIWGDHGETLTEHNSELFHHGGEVYETTIHVPLIIHAPSALPSGGVVGELTRTIDITPTVSDLAGLPPLTEYEGQSLMSLITPETATREWRIETTFVEATQPFNEKAEGDPRWRNQRKSKCIRTPEWKLVLSPLNERQWKLFNLKDDPGETSDVYAEQLEKNPRLVRDLSSRLMSWMNDFPDARAASGPGPDADARKKLEALGYFE